MLAKLKDFMSFKKLRSSHLEFSNLDSKMANSLINVTDREDQNWRKYDGI